MTDDRQQQQRVHVFVTGQVQGVNFRSATEEQARSLGLNGWVRNTDDGRVEAVFEGDPETVRQMLEWCQNGPSSADVEDVSTQEEEVENLPGFEVR